MHLRFLSLPIVLASLTSHAAAQEKPVATKPDFLLETFVYKQVGTLEIKADVLMREKTKTPRPVVVWIHGGALINGYRTGVPNWMREEFLPRGYAIVSIDYRLAPETKLPAIVDDVTDAFRWVRASGPELFAADPKRVAVCGGSAGGYLTFVTGYRVNPRPVALVSLWGYGDLGGPWTFEASKHACHNAAQKTSPEEAAKVALGPPVSDARERKGDGGAVYQYARRSGTWAETVTGWNPREQSAMFTPFVPERNVTPDYPPTIMLHGEADTDVPFESSVRMTEQLARHGVEHRLIRFAGAEHGLPNADRKKVVEAYHAAAEFVVRQLEKQ
ncbi:MAG: alpha/beta hydrolase [Planctomycetia bacterium]|nr:alpha/beta hydrolase [Planctomycetia bacterium]